MRSTSSGKVRATAARPRRAAATRSTRGEPAFLETARALVKVVREPAVLLDSALVVRAANTPFLDAWGLRPDEFVGKPFGSAGDAPRAPKALLEFLRHTLRSDAEHGEAEFDAGGLWAARAEVLRLTGAPGPVVLLALEDVSERRRAHESTRRAHQICERLLKNSDDGVFAFDLEQRFNLWNEGMERISGVAASEALGKPAALVFPEMAKQGADRAFLQVIDGKTVFTKNTPFRRAGPGPKIPSEAYYAPLTDPEGKIVGGLGIVRDVTGRVPTEEALRASEERFWRHLEDAQTGNLIATPDGSLLACNSAFARIFGLPSAESAIGGTIRWLFPERDGFDTLLDLVRTRRKLSDHEVELRRADGAVLHVIGNFTGTFDEKGVLLDLRGYLFDNTERRRLEEQLRQAQKMESIGTLAGGLAHDFNNLLNIVVAHVTLLDRNGERNSKRRASIDAIRTAAERGSGLVKQLLTFARKSDVSLERVDLNRAVEELVSMCREMFPRSIAFETTLAEGLPAIRSDANQLHQALLNLCINARDSMPSGGRLTIRTGLERGERLGKKHSGASGLDYPFVRVSDTGAGIDPADLERIFDPFFTTKEPGRGSGLGLAVVYGSVQSQGGFIDVESAPGRGASFTLYFPAAPPGEPPPDGRRDETEGETAGTETILVVEDEALLLDAIRELLEGEGYRVLTARDGIEALAVFQRYRRKIRLVMSDLGLPRLGGFELCLRLKERAPGVAVILASGYVEPREAANLLEAGAAQILRKPYVARELLASVRSALDA